MAESVLNPAKASKPELRHFAAVPVPTAYQGHPDFKLRVTEPVDLSSLGHVGGRDHSCGRDETGPGLGYPVAILLGGGEWCGHQDADQNHCRKAPSRYGCRIHEPLVGGKEPHDSSKMPTKRNCAAENSIGRRSRGLIEAERNQERDLGLSLDLRGRCRLG
jgi:hypothetical protein